MGRGHFGCADRRFPRRAVARHRRQSSHGCGQDTERFRRINYGTLEIELTSDDSKAYTRPWTIKVTQIIAPDTELMDYICLENERDGQHLPAQIK
jgi:hypothetical protein